MSASFVCNVRVQPTASHAAAGANHKYFSPRALTRSSKALDVMVEFFSWNGFIRICAADALRFSTQGKQSSTVHLDVELMNVGKERLDRILIRLLIVQQHEFDVCEPNGSVASVSAARERDRNEALTSGRDKGAARSSRPLLLL